MFNRARSIVGNAVVFNFNSILIVRIETENRNAAVRSAEPVGDAVRATL
ncbi:unknown [Sutterella wadsworthensis CAG:135]|nr:unknown [Sutterella wadsworthensis CAG:135]